MNNTKEKFIMSVDAGTTSCRTLIINKKGEVISLAQTEFTQIYPAGKSGWVEHDAIEILNSQMTTISQALAKGDLTVKSIAAIGITNQRETTVVWNKETGVPIYNAIVWQDRRTTDYCQQLINDGWKDKISAKTGLLIDSYFSATKIKWILDNAPNARELAREGKLAFGTVDSWLIYHMTSGPDKLRASHYMDITNASRTMLYNIHTNDWDEELLTLFDIPRNMLPIVKTSNDDFGYTYSGMLTKGDDTRVPICSAIGDQQGALFGQLCLEASNVKCTYGTGAFIIMNTGNKPVQSNSGLITTIAYQINGQKPVYALEGSVFIAGAAIQFLRDQWRMLYRSDESLWYAEIIKPEDKQRIYFVPAFVGLGAPYWDSNARGAIFGLERSTKREHVVAATLESLAYQTNDIILAMKQDMSDNVELKNQKIEIKVDGGASNNSYLMQFQSDISNTTVVKPSNSEATAMGAAYLAGLYIGFWKDISEIKEVYQISQIYKSKMAPDDRSKLLKGWSEAVKRTRNWNKDIE